MKFPFKNSKKVLTKSSSSGKQRPYDMECEATGPDSFLIRLNGNIVAYLQKDGIKALQDICKDTLKVAEKAEKGDKSDKSDKDDAPPKSPETGKDAPDDKSPADDSKKTEEAKNAAASNRGGVNK